MVALLLYASCLGGRLSWRIERLCERDIAFRVIAANQRLDHTTLARFRPTHETMRRRGHSGSVWKPTIVLRSQRLSSIHSGEPSAPTARGIGFAETCLFVRESERITIDCLVCTLVSKLELHPPRPLRGLDCRPV